MFSFEERLRHVSLKIQRAQEHAARLDEHLQTFLAAGPYNVGIRRDHLSRPVYFVASIESVPDVIALVAGDVMQNLMAALDHLAYRLVCKDTNDHPPNPSRIYFPLADDQASYDARKAGKLAGARATTVTAIDVLKPYKGGDDLLWSLYRLNNIEKHRLLLTVGAQAGGVHLGQLLAAHLPPEFPPEASTMLRQMSHFLMPADKGFPLTPGFSLYIGGPDEPFNSKLQFRFKVVLNEAGIAEGKPVSEFVREIVERVEVVVSALTPMLK